MRKETNILATLIFLFFLSCQTNENASWESDTRILSRMAYDSLNYMNIRAPFNHQRAEALRQMIMAEKDPMAQMNLNIQYGQEILKAGRTKDALELFTKIQDFLKEKNFQLDSANSRNLQAVTAIAYMRHGEIENCVHHHNHESCFIPIKGEGVHQLTYGSEGAIEIFENILKESPGDLETKYLLNVAYMTLGKYPDQVPSQHRFPTSWFGSAVPFKPFKEIAASLGVNRQSHAGGVVTDDFNNDGWLDIVATSWAPSDELVLYENDGKGGFKNMTAAYDLKGHMGSLNLNHTDFNNDGLLDLYIMRGGWLGVEGDISHSLLMNTGKGSFKDVTLESGLTKKGASQASSWADFNLDGFLDLIIAYESLPGYERGISLYINQGNGTFKDEALAYGLNINEFFKGVTAGDVNNDMYPDIYLSTQGSHNYLFINQGAKGHNSFVPSGPEADLKEPFNSFPCWVFDYDNDGWEDVFVSSYHNEGTPANHWVQSKLGKADPALLPKMYHNMGNGAFEEVGPSLGLNEIAFTMGCNFGDINTDGFLDFYLSTGNPLYQSIVPNKMYLNMEGKKFEDVSYSGGFANIQKGHGVGFADFDHDGDEDFYVVIGGAYDGDAFYNCLFENPNAENNNWVTLKLQGTKANKASIGARVRIVVEEGGHERMIHRTVTSGASFGANSLILELGLGKATAIKSVTVQWPCKDCADETFTGLDINRAYVLEQSKGMPKLLPYDHVPFRTNVQSDHHSHH